MNTPIDKKIVDGLVAELGITDFAKATIREVKQVAAKAEKASGVEFIKMEMGIPGLPAAQVGVDAQIKALQDGIAHSYPDIQGAPALKEAASQFVKAFIGVDIQPEGCVPVTGSMQGTFASFLTCSQRDASKDTVLFIDPGFPVQKMQLDVMGVKYQTFDVYDYRGEKLGPKLEGYLKQRNICAIVYSNPNNPSWICLREEELKVIGELATKYDAIVMEDLAYFAMDFRKDLSLIRLRSPVTPIITCCSSVVPRPSAMQASVSVWSASPTPCSIVISMTSQPVIRVCPLAPCSPPVCSTLCRQAPATVPSLRWQRCSRPPMRDVTTSARRSASMANAPIS